jgi:starch phosphorylase
MLFKRLDRERWKQSSHNPVKMLKELPEEILASTAEDPDYLRHYDAVLARFKHYMSTQGEWFGGNVADSKSLSTAYFSAADICWEQNWPSYRGLVAPG